MKIYTKKGDTGETSLFGGQRVYKNNDRVQAYGDVDEANSFIGVAASSPSIPEEIKEHLNAVMSDLFDCGISSKKCVWRFRVPHQEPIVKNMVL